MSAKKSLEGFGVAIGPGKRSRRGFEIMLSSYPRNRRDSDDQAIEWLGEVLDAGGQPGIAWALTKERWSAILKRRIDDDYDEQQLAARATWIWRHYHTRQLSNDDESPDQSAEHISKVWTANGGKKITSMSILAGAKRAENKLAALSWIQACIDANKGHTFGGGRPIPTEAETYKALDRAIERDIAPAYANVAPKRKRIGTK